MLSKEFLWGNSVSSMQTEGGWNEGGKGLSVYDIRNATEEHSDWHFANDNYHHFEEDFDFIKDLGMNCYRFQISWSRIVPDGDGEFNEEGFKYYHKIIDALISRGIKPMICLYHFDMPLSLAERYNGFVAKEVKEAFIRYGKKVVDEFSSKVNYWITFNEQNLYHTREAFKISGYLNDGPKTDEELYKISHNVMVSHAEIVNYIHDNYKNCFIGGMLAYSEVYPETCHPRDILVARKVDEFLNFTLLDAFVGKGYSDEVMRYVESHNIDMAATKEEIKSIKRQKSDFISFSYYASSVVSAENIDLNKDLPNHYASIGHKKNPYISATEWGWQIDPLGFRDVLNKLYQRYRIPIFILENGIGVREKWDGQNPIQDDYRIEYHKNHLLAMYDAINIDGVKVIGYLGWGLIDILSSQGDMEKRYGLVYVNRGNHDLRDMRRVPKKSYDWFKNVIKSNGESIRR
ncbi:glycoside hydrolase family 1 protein [Streptococcus dentiloxodontae]